MMTYTVVNTRRAELDIHRAAAWWAEHRSAEQASRWLDGIHKKIQSLRTKSAVQRCRFAPEHRPELQELRELYFGLGRQPTHRIIFTVAEDLVLVLAVRHLAQDELTSDELR